MLFTMFQKTYPVLDFVTKNNGIHSIVKIYNEARIPLNIQNNLSEESLEKWLYKRAIPLNRLNYRELYKIAYQKNFWNLLKITGGFNLSDQYWFREDSMDITWQTNNYFTNNFSNDIGNFLITKQSLKNDSVLTSPDLFTNGNNPKTWRIKHQERFLLKGSLTYNSFDCINEKIIAEYINRMNIPFLICPETNLTKIKGELFCCSKNFITEKTELVPAHYITDYKQKDKEKMLYHHLEDMCELLKIPNYKPFLNAMLAVDSFMCQSDRHLGNFAFIRDVETLKFIGPAPLYDNGNCLWYKEDLSNIGNSLFDANCKPFAFFHQEQNKFIDDTEILKYINTDILKEVLMTNAEELMDKERIKKIISSTKRRETELQRTILNKNRIYERENMTDRIR